MGYVRRRFFHTTAKEHSCAMCTGTVNLYRDLSSGKCLCYPCVVFMAELLGGGVPEPTTIAMGAAAK
jgi:hypothetical protein